MIYIKSAICAYFECKFLSLFPICTTAKSNSTWCVARVNKAKALFATLDTLLKDIQRSHIHKHTSRYTDLGSSRLASRLAAARVSQQSSATLDNAYCCCCVYRAPEGKTLQIACQLLCIGIIVNRGSASFTSRLWNYLVFFGWSIHLDNFLNSHKSVPFRH